MTRNVLSKCLHLRRVESSLRSNKICEFFARWKIWLTISIFAGTPFGLLMFGALQRAQTRLLTGEFEHK